MASIKSMLAQAKDVQEEIGHLLSARYSVSRSENFDLCVNFENGNSTAIPFVPLRMYQKDQLQRKLFEEGIKRILIEWPRRAGKEYGCFQVLVEAAIIAPGLYMMVYPTNVRARAILWEGYILLQDGTSLPFINMVPRELIAKIDNQAMKIHLVNGSIIWIVGSDIDPDKLRGTNPRGIVYAEFAFQDPRVFYIMLPVLRQNGGWLVGQSTFDGMNHFYRMIENNKNDPLWFCAVESVVSLVDENGNRYITDEMIEEDRRAGMPEYLIQQEYYGIVEINQETKYFAIAMNEIYKSNRIIQGLLLKSSNVYAALDIGVNDMTSVVLFQVKQIDNYYKPVVIGYLENNNRDLNFYVGEVRQFCARYNLPFKYYFLPHDGAKRDFNNGLKTTPDYLSEIGETGIIVERPKSHHLAHQLIRKYLYLTEFNKENTIRVIDCLSSYSKVFDEKLGVYKNEPLHNWASHGVKAYQTMALALDAGLITERMMETIYID